MTLATKDPLTPRDQANNPLFANPEGYLKLRQKKGILGAMKIWSERKALFACLKQIPNVTTMLDIPCGPGRAFPYYQERGYQVMGMDFSPQMSAAATKYQQQLGLTGMVCRGDAFRLPFVDNTFDTVVSVRFSYYFERAQRIALIRELARVSRQAIVVQVKIDYSLHSRSRKWRGKSKSTNRGKFMLSKNEINQEFAEAGMEVMHLAPLSRIGSDRAFVLARPK